MKDRFFVRLEMLVYRMLDSTLGFRWRQWMKDRGSWRMINRSRGPGLEPEPYLERFYLLRLGPVGVFLHNFHSSDPDAYHDHPWPFATLRLAGGYHESGVDEVWRWKPAGSASFAGAERFHKVRVDEGTRGRCWTLFVHGPRWREWGFLEDEGWSSAASTDNQSSRRVEGRIFPKFPRKALFPSHAVRPRRDAAFDGG